MKKILLLSISILFLYSCSSKDDDFKEWITNRGGTKFETSDMDFLINEFGRPIDTINLSETKKFGYGNKNFFWGPYFDKNESLRIIQEFKNKRKKIDEWMIEKGKSDGVNPISYLSSGNPNYGNYKSKLDDLYNEYEILYKKISGGEKITFSEFVLDYNKKFPEFTLKQCQDSIAMFLNLSDFRKKEFTSITYRFVTDDNESYHKRYGNKNLRNFKVLIYRDLTINNNGTIDENIYNDSYCINESSKEDLMDYVIGDWVYGDVMGAYKFMDDGTYSMSNSYTSKRGKWWIDCSGEIVCSKQNSSLKVTNEGIMAGTTLYKRYNEIN